MNTSSKGASTVKKRRQYSETQLIDSLNAIRSGKSVNNAARLFGVPKSTLQRYTDADYKHWKKVGVVPLLSEDEEMSLASYMRWCEDKNIPFTYDLMKVFCLEILKKKSDRTKISTDWCRDFMKRNNFSPRKSRHVEVPRVVASSTPENIIEYYELLTQQLTQLQLIEKPCHIWNCDEKGWSKNQNLQQSVIVTKGRKQATTRQIFVNEHITTLHCISAAGRVLDPLVIFNRNIPTTMNVKSLPDNWMYGSTESGYINGDLFYQWFRDLFIPQIGRERPQILIFDAATPHITIDIIKLAIKENVSLLSLPGKTTAFLQPVDQIISVMSSKFSEIAYKLSFTKFDFLVRPCNFPHVLSQAIKIAWPKKTVVEAFRKTGMYPPSAQPIIENQQLSANCRDKISRHFRIGQEFISGGHEADVADIVEADLPHSTAEVPDIAVPDANEAQLPITQVDETSEVSELCDECGRPINNPCDSCIAREKRRNNILFKTGQITEDLINILETPSIPKPKKRTRLVKSKIVSSADLLKDLEERENKKQSKTQKRKTTVQCDSLPNIHPPKRTRKSRQQGTKEIDVTVESVLDDEVCETVNVNASTRTDAEIISSQVSGTCSVDVPQPEQHAENVNGDASTSCNVEPIVNTAPKPVSSSNRKTRCGRRIKVIDYNALSNGTCVEDMPQPVNDKGKKRREKKRTYKVNECGDHCTVNEECLEIYTCPACNVTADADDDLLGILWYGCDKCNSWWHRDCLSPDIRAIADLSCMESSVTFLCPHCVPNIPCSVCLVPIIDFSQRALCKVCKNVYHISCLPDEFKEEFFRYCRINKDWFCNQCIAN